MISDIKKGIIIAVSFSITVGLIGLTYSAWINITNVSNGQTLDAAMVNNLISNQNDLNSRISGTSIPTGFIGSFYLTSCPSGWVIADGTNSTPDLRGKFIRANITNNTYDPDYTLRTGGLGDANKVGSIQQDDFKSHTHSFRYLTYGGGALVTTMMAASYDQRSNTLNGPILNYTGGTETRPKNIALLFCMKQ